MRLERSILKGSMQRAFWKGRSLNFIRTGRGSLLVSLKKISRVGIAVCFTRRGKRKLRESSRRAFWRERGGSTIRMGNCSFAGSM